MSAPTTIFADSFDIAECHCARRAKPVGHLAPMKVHLGMTLPENFGRAVLNMFIFERQPVARVVSMKTGEVAWYDVTVNAESRP